MEEVLLLKCGELVLKGLNRSRFEERLLKNLRDALRKLGDYEVTSSQSAICVRDKNGAPLPGALEACRRVFGIVTVFPALRTEKDMDTIKEAAKEYFAPALNGATTYKVTAKRSDKHFPLTSPQISAELGGYLSDVFPHLKAQMDDPELTIRVEIRDRHAFLTGPGLPGAGGMPGGSAGRAMLLLSGGIDSPVAGYMMAKRGLDLCAVHFFSYPYTSLEAREKVLELGRILSGYTGKLTVCVVPFTKIQQEIRAGCKEEYFTLVMRRMMMRIAEQAAEKQDCGALITGESLGQVASQTMEALQVTGAVCTLPVFRPLIGMDKEEIVARARAIGTFDTSILPYEDCCTVFTPKHPRTKPRLEFVEAEESRLDVGALVAEAVNGVERITLG